MLTSRDFLRVEYNVLSKNVTRDVSQSEKTLSEVIYKCTYCILSISKVQQSCWNCLMDVDLKSILELNYCFLSLALYESGTWEYYLYTIRIKQKP